MDQTLPTEATQYALRVALQTMKERCQILQKRLNSLEDENQQLRAGRDDIKSTSSFASTPSVGFAAENFQLRLSLAELERQKSQLTEQVNMVSTENRKLWSRLSQMAKDQEGRNMGEHDDTLLANSKSELLRSGANQSSIRAKELIRSKTFTQHSPNPNLRLKVISSADGNVINLSTNIKDLSLEEVALSTDADEETPKSSAAEIGFSYLIMDESNYNDATDAIEADFQLEVTKCANGLQELKREALQQQKDLQLAIAVLRQRLPKSPCPECAQKSKKPEMADKSLETDESITEAFHDSQAAAAANIPTVHNSEASGVNPPRLNFIQEKIEADARLKTCPMCGSVYGDSVSFQKFCEHVESHFNSETSDFGSMAEHDFECISSTVGNF